MDKETGAAITIIAIWAFAVLACLAVTGVVIWGIIKLVNHFI